MPPLIDAPPSAPAWPCHCDERGIGKPGVTCGDCPRDYGHTVTSAPSGEPAAVVYPPDGTVSPFTVINLGSGKVQMGDSIHDGRLPALWFGKNGKGMGHEEDLNREAHEGETLAVVTFANVEGLDVLADVVQRIRRVSFPGATAAPAPQATTASVAGLASPAAAAPKPASKEQIEQHLRTLTTDPAVLDVLRAIAHSAPAVAAAVRGLTEAAVRAAYAEAHDLGPDPYVGAEDMAFARAIEAAHGIATPAPKEQK